MRLAPILLFVLGSSCAANAERVAEERQPVTRNAAAPEPSGEEAIDEVVPAQVPETGGHSTPHQLEPAATATPPWGCEVQTNEAGIRKHLGLDNMGPTGSEVRLPREPGFVRFDGKGDVYYAGYICETWSADSDECDGSVVQIVELATVSGTDTKVIWRSEPQLGSGGWCGSKEPSGTFRDLAVADYDRDGRPDLRFSATNPARATVRMFDGTHYDARLPENVMADPEFDPCRPATGLVYTVQKGSSSKAAPATEIPVEVKAALAEAYLPSAECPDAVRQ